MIHKQLHEPSREGGRQRTGVVVRATCCWHVLCWVLSTCWLAGTSSRPFDAAASHAEDKITIPPRLHQFIFAFDVDNGVYTRCEVFHLRCEAARMAA